MIEMEYRIVQNIMLNLIGNLRMIIETEHETNYYFQIVVRNLFISRWIETIVEKTSI